ncbi:hypothetical protein B0H13DRAFT_1452798, partial [Mycena leptocephala]
AKLWAIYVSEAEKYDRGLVESWKSDMEGILIFVCADIIKMRSLSASLTAFLIESYKTLIPNSTDTSALLLAQISQQIAASANGTSFHSRPQVPEFTPLTSSLVCNILWFISLGLSLSCALIATLLEQWGTGFPAQSQHALCPSYPGTQRFNMHMVVELIPLLLHASLVFFWPAFVAFLIPVNIIITTVAGVMLATMICIYGLLTLL